MIIGAHVLLHSEKPDSDRAFFRDVLGFRSLDVGGGWLIFQLPPAEMAVHPAEAKSGQVHGGHRLLGAVLYFMCDDLEAQIQLLKEMNVSCTEVETAPWGIKTTIVLPSGGEIGLYQPSHALALHLDLK